MKAKKYTLQYLFLLTAALFFTFAQAAPEQSSRQKPNFLIIVVDDVGMADLGSFGGEIPTPHLDAIAEKGIRFSNFHTAPTCSPTRAMLLTGLTPHQAGLGNMYELLAPNQKGSKNYRGELNDETITLSTILQQQGYNTYISGKWHLGGSPDTIPSARGFDRSFTLISGGASHFADMKPAYHPDPNAPAPFMKDGKKLTKLPDNFSYSSQFFVDELIDYLEADKDNGKPFFAMLTFTAPHWPLQAPAATIEKYKGKYDKGYDWLRKKRLEKQKELGIIPASAVENSPSPKYTPWDQLSGEQKRVEARSMEIYAAMIDEIDQHSGRLFDYLKKENLFDNTVILFLSDNGPEGHDLDETWPAEFFPEIRANINKRFDFSYENMGHPNSYVFYGHGWARAGSPALGLYKGFPTEGGIRTPAFIYHKNFIGGEITDRYFSVQDVTPTVLAMLNIQHPSAKNKNLLPISAHSMLEALQNKRLLHEPKEFISGGELVGKYYIRKGDWKMIHMPKPHGNDEWQLYNLKTDMAEAHDVYDQHPEIAADLKTEWKRYATENGVILPDWVSGY